jgi:6-pyruvoyltetrahydropterin/6-carboxytetrahydropterin synthase
MTSPGRFRIVLAKEDFKFACAHFTVFAPGKAELLHGHNYRVAVEVAGERLGDHGLLVDIERLKAEIRRLCAELDSRTLVPAASPLVAVAERPGRGAADESAAAAEVEVRFGARRYVIPAADALILPIANTTMELLAELLWRRLAPALAPAAPGARVDTLAVSVEESAGQRCVFERAL